MHVRRTMVQPSVAGGWGGERKGMVTSPPALISASRAGMRDKTDFTGRMAWLDGPAIITQHMKPGGRNACACASRAVRIAS